MNWIQRFLNAIATHKGDASAHHPPLGGAFLIVAAADTPATLKNRADYVGDGAHDMGDVAGDEDEINTALGLVDTVILCPGTYWVNNPISMASNKTLLGGGPGCSIKIRDSKDANIDMIVNSDAVSGNDHIVIKNLKLDGNKANNTAGNQYGIRFAKVAPSGTAPGCKIVDCFAENFRNIGIFISNSKNSTISGNHCSNNGLAGSYQGICLSECSNNTISGNTCQGNEGGGILISGCSDNTISGNTCQGNGYHGICLDLSSDNTISGNTCQGNGYQGILINASSDNTVTGNTCQENIYNGINLAASSERNTISGNNCSRNGESGICFHTTSNNTIAGNLCQRNGRYGIVFVTASNNTIAGNTIVENSQMEDIKDDNINLQTNSNYNLFTGNVCRKASVSTTLTGAHGIGVTTITLASTAGFRAGGGITFNPGGGNDETKIVATITDATHLTITLGLTNDHINAEPVIVPRTRYGIYIWDANCIKNLLIGNDLYDAGNTANLNDGGTLTIVQDDNREIEITQVRHYINVKNTSGGAMAVGDVTSLKAVAAGNEITPPVAVGERQVYGMVAEVIADTASGLVLVKGFTNALKGTNVGGGNIAIGDNLITENGVRARKAAADTDPIFARALEVCNAADVTIDAYIKSPWD